MSRKQKDEVTEKSDSMIKSCLVHN